MANLIIDITEISQTNLWAGDLTGNINIKFNLYYDDESSESVEYTIGANSFTETSTITTPSIVSVDIPKSNFELGSNVINIGAGGEEYNYDIIKEDRDTFTLERRLQHDTSHTLTNTKLIHGEGIGLTNTEGSVVIQIPTGGKAKVESVGVNVDADVVSTDELEFNMDYQYGSGTGKVYEKGIDLSKYKTINNIKVVSK